MSSPDAEKYGKIGTRRPGRARLVKSPGRPTVKGPGGPAPMAEGRAARAGRSVSLAVEGERPRKPRFRGRLGWGPRAQGPRARRSLVSRRFWAAWTATSAAVQARSSR